MFAIVLPLLGIALLLGMTACGGGGGGGSSSTPTSPTAPAPPNTVTIQVLDFEFEPRSVTINAGDTVRWVFDGQDRTHTSTAKDMTWDSEFVFQQVGDAFQWTSSAADDGQTFEYSCRTHDNSHDMKGSIRVGTNAPAPSPGY
jgi:proline-rich tail region repeat protein